MRQNKYSILFFIRDRFVDTSCHLITVQRTALEGIKMATTTTTKIAATAAAAAAAHLYAMQMINKSQRMRSIRTV